jgi:hypothetical protein
MATATGRYRPVESLLRNEYPAVPGNSDAIAAGAMTLASMRARVHLIDNELVPASRVLDPSECIPSTTPPEEQFQLPKLTQTLPRVQAFAGVAVATASSTDIARVASAPHSRRVSLCFMVVSSIPVIWPRENFRSGIVTSRR